MKVKYKLSKNEYLEAMQLHHKMGYRKLLMFVYIAFATTMMLIVTDYSDGREIFRNFGALFFGVAFYLLLTQMIGNYQSKKFYDKSETLSNEVTLRVTGRGIKIDDQEKSISWNAFTKYKQDSKYFILYTSLNNFKIIPKLAMKSAELKDFSTMLKKHIDMRDS